MPQRGGRHDRIEAARALRRPACRTSGAPTFAPSHAVPAVASAPRRSASQYKALLAEHGIKMDYVVVKKSTSKKGF